MSDPIIKLDNVWVKYGSNIILEDISMEVRADDFLGIIGPNGGGKTTLLKTILGLIDPYKGTVRVFDESPEKGSRHVGYVPQHSDFDSDYPISVLEVVLMGRLNKKGLGRRYSKEDIKTAEHVLEMVEMEDYVDRQISKLSGGQKQRVFIGRALASEPNVLILDEPTASVDKAMQGDIYSLLKKLNSTIPIVMVTHDVGVISSYVERVACLNRKLFCHDSGNLTQEMLDKAYACPVEMIAHGVPHRVFEEH